MTVSLYPHQVAAIQAAAERFSKNGRGYYLRHDPGLGKTLTTILLVQALGLKTVGVVGPVIALGTWQKELAKWWPASRGCVVRADGGTSWHWMESALATFHLTNYDQMRKADQRAHFLRFDGAGGKGDLLVMDEAQAIKSISSSTSKELRKMAGRFEKILLLSGTPAHSPLDWYVPFRLIAPENDFWASQTYTEYKQRVAYLGGPHNQWVTGWDERVKREAAKNILPYCHIATSDELKLPEPIWTPITFRLGEDEANAYRSMDKNLSFQLPNDAWASAELVITKHLRLHQITGGHITDESGTSHCLGKSKLQSLVDVLEERRHQKVVVACRFRPEIDAIAGAVGFREPARGKMKLEGGHYVMTITGDTAPEERARIERVFQETPEPCVLVLQYRAGGASITLSEASSLVFYSFEPSTIAFRQMIGRVWRIGQTRHCQMIPLMAEGTIDEKLYRGLCLGLDGVDLANYIEKEVA